MHIYRVHLILLSAFLLMCFGCKEETITPEEFGTINGAVQSAEDNTLLAGASISTSPPTIAVVTDAAGHFTIPNITTGNYLISATKQGFKKGSISVAVRSSKTTDAVILLERGTLTDAPPNQPTTPSPAHQSEDQPTSLRLSWSATDPDANDTLRYDVYLFESGSSARQVVAMDSPDTSVTVQGLKFSTTYYWQVVVKDKENIATNGVVWSFRTRAFPDNRIVFARETGGSYEIFSVDTLGQGAIQLTATTGRQWWPRISPRRDRIAFSSDQAVEPQIWTISREGADAYQVTRLAVVGAHNFGTGFAWSPDGATLLYSHYDKLYRIDAGGGNLGLIATAPAGRHFRECAWSPLGDQIVAVTVGSNPYNGEIYIMNADGSGMRQLLSDLPGVIGGLAFSADGRSILYTRDASGYESPDGRQLDARIYLMRVDSTETVDLSITKSQGTNDLYPRFSPDGAKVIFANMTNDGSAPADVYVMDIRGNTRRRLVVNGTMPDWK